MKNGVNFVALLGIILKIHRTEDSSSIHFLLNLFK